MTIALSMGQPSPRTHSPSPSPETTSNWRRHHEDERNLAARHAAVDPYSSAPAFTGWRDRPAVLDLPADYRPLPTVRATCWLLTTGWRRHRPLSVREEPGPLASAVRRRATQIMSLEDRDD